MYFFFFAFVFSKWFNILLQCSYTFSSASFALVFPCPFPPILLLWWWQLLVFLSRDTEQCSFLVICIFCVPPCCLFFSPSLTCVKDASSYARVFTDNILHVCVYSKWQKKKKNIWMLRIVYIHTVKAAGCVGPADMLCRWWWGKKQRESTHVPWEMEALTVHSPHLSLLFYIFLSLQYFRRCSPPCLSLMSSCRYVPSFFH